MKNATMHTKTAFLFVSCWTLSLCILSVPVLAVEQSAAIAVGNALTELQEYDGEDPYYLDLEIAAFTRGKGEDEAQRTRTQILCGAGRTHVNSAQGQMLIDAEHAVGLLDVHKRIIVRKTLPEDKQGQRMQSAGMAGLRDSVLAAFNIELDEEREGLRHIVLRSPRALIGSYQIVRVHAWLNPANGALERLIIDFSPEAAYVRAEYTVHELQRGAAVTKTPPDPLKTVFRADGSLLASYADYALIDLREGAND